MVLARATAVAGAFLSVAGVPLAALADDYAVLWQMGLQKSASPIMTQISGFHDGLLILITIITLSVTALLAYVMVRFRAKANPNPSRRTHNTTVEVVWTVVPVIILAVMAIPSFELLYRQDVLPKADLTVKAIGHQWYWSYEYPDHGNFGFDSTMIPDGDLKPGQPRLLAVDEHIVVPVNKVVKVIVTADDVIHAWAVPAFGVKIDAVPGRSNQTWFKAERTGTFYGQCSELCGVNHGFMPIRVDVVSQADFDAWVARKRQTAGREGTDRRQVARNDAAR